MKRFTINSRQALRQRIRSASLSSKIWFCLSAVCFLMTILSRFLSAEWILLTGLFVVLWLSTVALHSVKKRTSRRNPFTALTIISLVLSASLLLTASMRSFTYNEANEPINHLSRTLQKMLDAGNTVEQIEGYGSFSFNGLDFNIVVTDAQHNVLYSATSWKTGGAQVLRPLICPAPFDSTGRRLVIMVDGQGNVVSTFQADEAWLRVEQSPIYSSLTISDEETEAVSDPLFEKYFPSFGALLDEAAIELLSAELYVEGAGGRTEYLQGILEWKGEEIDHIEDMSLLSRTTPDGKYFVYDYSKDSPLVQELNALDETQRTAYLKYLKWLDAARLSIYQTNPQRALRVRLMTSSDGQRHLYLLHDYDEALLYPLRIKISSLNMHSERIRLFGIALIPASLVFLSFWVFVDARKRAHAHPALWAVLTLLGNVVAWLIYMMIRPDMAVGASGLPAPKGACPMCGARLRNDFVVCPVCGILLRNKCAVCHRPLENDWNFCPYCAAAIVQKIGAASNEQPETSPEAESLTEEAAASAAASGDGAETADGTSCVSG